MICTDSDQLALINLDRGFYLVVGVAGAYSTCCAMEKRKCMCTHQMDYEKIISEVIYWLIQKKTTLLGGLLL